MTTGSWPARVITHRREAASLLDYMRHDDAEQRKAADELTTLTQDMGIDEPR